MIANECVWQLIGCLHLIIKIAGGKPLDGAIICGISAMMILMHLWVQLCGSVELSFNYNERCSFIALPHYFTFKHSEIINFSAFEKFCGEMNSSANNNPEKGFSSRWSTEIRKSFNLHEAERRKLNGTEIFQFENKQPEAFPSRPLVRIFPLLSRRRVPCLLKGLRGRETPNNEFRVKRWE